MNKLYHGINRLIHYGLTNELIDEYEVDYAVNLLLDLFHLDHFEYEEISETLSEPSDILAELTDHIESPVEKDLFAGRIMNTITPRPATVISRFRDDYAKDPKLATDHYYAFSIATNYIRKARVDRNIRWTGTNDYGNLEISINLSKPEKDPRDIARARNVKSSGYPKCLLCKENVGFCGDLNRDTRLTHRVIPLNLNDQPYYLQYSPYVYYNEHCIVFHEEHKPMKIDRGTFANILEFVRQFPHYMLGSNADLPIVGGSILSHDHYQGGRYHFPIQDAKIFADIDFGYPDVKAALLYWPLTTIRLQSSNRLVLVDLADHLLKTWKEYEDHDLDIYSHTGSTPHQAITPIARKNGSCYELDLVLRNNRTSSIYPDGIFHPHPACHHIKKENIGLIEVMGLAILPGRLKTELELLEKALKDQINFDDEPSLEKHRAWYEELKKLPYHEGLLEEEVVKVFTTVLEDAGVYKLKEESGRLGVRRFIRAAKGEYHERFH